MDQEYTVYTLSHSYLSSCEELHEHKDVCKILLNQL